MVAQGSSPAFAELFKRHGGRVLGYCARIVGERAAGEDLSQEVWIKVAKAAPDWRPEASLRAWLLTIARNAALNHLRRQNRLELMGESEEPEAPEASFALDRLTIEDKLIAAEDKKRVAHAIDGLSDQKRAALMMWLNEQLSQDEIARELGITLAAVKSLLHRARNELESRLSDEKGGRS